ncbi:protein strawberry notch homolog 2 isoform X1 [Gopherus evgoodei]|uniref:Protein strawberry notch homolog 2 n=1 Tax=Gopherus evgoodei TaxID=1825980 RepID=A0A8C4WSG6_9SAUR|nr:protein strawberry notch homolog 2 isoform X1 [Gopherus evgoodei]XP_030396723.1 protein strawberry notch homolog 2 isoform X1 [Gopherus evgoodei]XP_030396724.1 protein strawberry notch homolog 2 isoform X1 [Gopherus evgoodei]XP_030396726.1 protein strawberry notch homolog 2 isoform X1 [Gopherus evgoodei]XP_030396727.1 protein strawberry notch homolog 2 isoform X1 [Gopherus evgoodei]XP_030396728.1 protein strawberry notch homolog 2 isoform X1 [Gopherus evgoodei]
MPSAHLAMDGGKNFPQHEHQQSGSTLYSIPNLQTQLSVPAMENSMLAPDWWNSFYSPAPFSTPSFSSENQQYFNTTSDFYMNSISRPPFTETNYASVGFADFLPKNGDFPQDSSYLDELSNNSLFSSPADSLSDIADAQDFLPADSLNHVPTLWDINPSQQNQIELFSPSRPFTGLESLEDHPPNTPLLISYQSQTPVEEDDEGDEEETEELGHTETYADYVPSKSKIGKQHPDRVVETSTLSSVPPPDITYTLSLPSSIADDGLLSALQLEAIVYACQQHEVLLPNGQRAGFLIGDGAGVGKGRTVAGIIFENYLKGRKKSLWFSVSNDLKYDAERDLKDIDAPNIPVHALNKIKYGDTATSEGVLFATYSALIGESQAGGQHRTRLKQILDWCRENFDGVIVFDECHKAKNASSTKMGKAVLDLQNKLPRARVVYASATGASEPKNMIYMSRLGIWGEGTPFRAFDEFLHAIEKRGVGAMEIVAMDMKVSGMYIARQLSFSGVTFKIEEIPLHRQYELVYNKAAQLWAEAMVVFQQAADYIGLESRKSLWGQFWSAHQRFFKYLCIAAKVRRLVELAKEELAKDKCIVIGLQSTGEARTREVLDENDGHLNCFVSAAEGVFLSLIQKHFPSTKRKREKGTGIKRKRKQKGRCVKALKGMYDMAGVIKISDDSSTDSEVGLDSDFNSSPESLFDNDDVIFVEHTYNGFASEDRGILHLPGSQNNVHGPGVLEHVEKMKQDLLSKVKALGKELPLNTLDELIDHFGGPEYVAEMTGRKGRVVRRPDGSIMYESRAEQGLSIDHVNLKEKERFMSGEKLVAIISEASSSGISLQADRRVRNQKRRVHMTLELPWSADRAIQQFGRTHRSNQVSAPEYVFLISELAGERRFASIVAKRLESLGALTHGDRRATESRDLSKYNFENKYGTRALDRVLTTILNQTKSKVPLPKYYQEREAEFFQEMKQGLISVGICCKEMKYGYVSVEKDCSITKFLNRILGLEVHKQNMLFQYFTDTFDHLIEKDKKEGKYDMGILDLAPGVDEIYEESKEVFLTPGHPQDGQVVFYEISVDRGLKWEEAYEKSLKLTGTYDGFYLSHKTRGCKYTCLLAEQGRGKNFILYKPNIGKQSQPESLESLFKKYRQVPPEEAKEHWESSYLFSFTKCNHAVWNRTCKLIQEGKECFQGMRLRRYYMLCGALLRVWSKIASIMSDITNTSYLQIVRLKTKEKKKQVGIKIPESCVHRVREELKQMDENVKQKHNHQALLAQDRSLPYSMPQHVLQQPHDLCQPVAGLPLPRHSLHQDGILDLTYSPPSDSLSNLALKPNPLGTLHFQPEPVLQPHQQHRMPLHFSLPPVFESPAPALAGSMPLNLPPHDHVSLPHPDHLQTLPQQQLPPEDLAQQQNINFKEVLEDMLRTLYVAPQDSALSQERQSVIQFSRPFEHF